MEKEDVLRILNTIYGALYSPVNTDAIRDVIWIGNREVKLTTYIDEQRDRLRRG